MELKELDRLAKLNEPLPTGLTFYETAYYITSRCLYRQYEKQEISLEQAKAEKEQVIEQYRQNKEAYEFMIRIHEVEAKLKELKQQGFNNALEWEILEILERLD